MEVTVLEAHNTPRKPVVEFRAGASLRHAELALHMPFHVPLDSSQDNRVKVSLYTQLGTQTIPDADELESVCNVPVRTPDGKCSQVKLHIRRGQATTGFNFKTSDTGAEDYLNNHQLEACIQGLFETVLKTQPRDPYRCMIEELQKLKHAGEEAMSELDVSSKAIVPMTPVAPAEAPPKNARPSPSTRARNLTPSVSDGTSQAERDTKAALSEILQQPDSMKQSSSLGTARIAHRYEASKVLSNLELAHEVMRLCIRQVVANMATQSSSLGLVGADPRVRAIEHTNNVKLARHVMAMAMRSAYNRLEAMSVGFMGGGHTKSDKIVFIRDPASLAQETALTKSVIKMLLCKAAQELAK